MIIEANCYYRARNGDRAYVVGKNPWTGTWIVIFEKYPRQEFHVLDNGQVVNAIQADSCDLVVEWREPVSKEVYAFLMLENEGQATERINVYLSYSKHDKWAGRMLAKKTITIKEGEGMDQ